MFGDFGVFNCVLYLFIEFSKMVGLLKASNLISENLNCLPVPVLGVNICFPDNINRLAYFEMAETICSRLNYFSWLFPYIR